MTDSAVDRASVAIANALGIPSCSTEAARRIAETLLDRPSLLVDLALEAGGLELYDGCGHCIGRDACRMPPNTDCLPVYRRKEAT